jgi:RNA polymerase sigma-70 factor (ECF subfamily)
MGAEGNSMGAEGKQEDSGVSFTEWYQAEYGGLVRTLVVVVGDVDVATEAVSEAFVRALQRWTRVSQMESPTAWTYTVAFNVARRTLRRARLESVVLRRHTPAPPPVREDALEVWDAVQRLPLRQRTAVALYYLSDLPQKDVAIAMGVAEGTVAATLHEARRRLATTLAQPIGKDVIEYG